LKLINVVKLDVPESFTLEVLLVKKRESKKLEAKTSKIYNKKSLENFQGFFY